MLTGRVAHCNAVLGGCSNNDIVIAHCIIAVGCASCSLEGPKQFLSPVLQKDLKFGTGCNTSQAVRPRTKPTSVSWPRTPSHLSPSSFLIVALLRIVSSCWLTSTRQPDLVSISSQRSPGSSFVTTTRFLPSSLKTCRVPEKLGD